MAEPQDSATLLMDVSALLQTDYMPNLVEQAPGRFGKTTNSLFSPASQVAHGDGLTMQFETGRADSVRTGIDPNGAVAAPSVLAASSMRFRFTDVNPTATNHDFTQFSASVQFAESTIVNGGDNSVVDLCERVYKSVADDYGEKLAIARNIGRDGVLALVNGTPKANNKWYLSGATGTATNALGARFAVDNGSISTIRNNARYDILSPAGVVRAGNIRCVRNNTTDYSAGFEFVTTGIATDRSTGNLANIADNDLVVFSGGYGKGMYSKAAYFARPAATDSFVGGLDRNLAANQWLLPVTTREGESATLLTRSMFDDAAIAMGYQSEDPNTGMVVIMSPRNLQRLRNEIGEASFIQIPIDDTRLKRFANFGSMGLNYQHSQFGMMKFNGDPLKSETSVEILDPKTWKTLFWGTKGLIPIKQGGEHFYRMPEPTPNTGLSLYRKADWYGNQADFCTQPWMNCQILNLSAS